MLSLDEQAIVKKLDAMISHLELYDQFESNKTTKGGIVLLSPDGNLKIKIEIIELN